MNIPDSTAFQAKFVEWKKFNSNIKHTEFDENDSQLNISKSDTHRGGSGQFHEHQIRPDVLHSSLLTEAGHNQNWNEKNSTSTNINDADDGFEWKNVTENSKERPVRGSRESEAGNKIRPTWIIKMLAFRTLKSFYWAAARIELPVNYCLFGGWRKRGNLPVGVWTTFTQSHSLFCKYLVPYARNLHLTRRLKQR